MTDPVRYNWKCLLVAGIKLFQRRKVMSNDNVFERLFKLWASICKMIVDLKRDPEKVAKVLQDIVDDSGHFVNVKDFSIVVPENYNHERQLESFESENYSKFWFCDTEIHYKFQKSATKLVPGQKLLVKIFQQIGLDVSRDTMSEKCLKFLKDQKSILTGARGASLVFEQRCDELGDENGLYLSYDEKDGLYNSRSEVTALRLYNKRKFSFIAVDSDYRERGLNYYVFCFYKEK